MLWIFVAAAPACNLRCSFLLAPRAVGPPRPARAPPRLSRAAVTAAATLDVGAVVPTRAPAAVGADAWAASLDYPAFRAEVNALGKRLEDGQGEADVRHLKKMLAWSNACALVGVATMWMSGPLARLLPIVALSTWTCTRWTMIGHHICHGGYNRQDDRRVGGSGRFTSAGFAVGSAWRARATGSTGCCPRRGTSSTTTCTTTG